MGALRNARPFMTSCRLPFFAFFEKVTPLGDFIALTVCRSVDRFPIAIKGCQPNSATSGELFLPVLILNSAVLRLYLKGLSCCRGLFWLLFSTYINTQWLCPFFFETSWIPRSLPPYHTVAACTRWNVTPRACEQGALGEVSGIIREIIKVLCQTVLKIMQTEDLEFGMTWNSLL